MVKHLKWVINVDKFDPKTNILMHQDIPLIQIKNFHLEYCGGPVFLSSSHVVGIVIFKLHDINFAVHLSAIKEFCKGVDLSLQCKIIFFSFFKADAIMINYPNVPIIFTLYLFSVVVQYLVTKGQNPCTN